MDKKNYQPAISTQFSLPKNLTQNERTHYEKIHKELPKMEENHLTITGVELKTSNLHTIKVAVFIRSTLKKEITMKPTKIVLLDANLVPFAEKDESFTNLGTVPPNTSKLFTIEFSKEHLKQSDINQLNHWSLAFNENIKHRIDYSGFDVTELSTQTKTWLKELAHKEPLKNNELSFMPFSAKLDKSSNLLVYLLIRNGTHDNLDIKQLPLKFYDATEELIATGLFTFEEMTVLANTSKPIAFVFPLDNIKKDHLDLSSWSLVHDR